jgi:hypothetical protein
VWFDELSGPVDAAVSSGVSTILSPPPSATNHKPDAVIELQGAVALFDSAYSRYPHVFRLILKSGRQYLFQTEDYDTLSTWLGLINYASAFLSAGIQMRGVVDQTELNNGGQSRSQHSYVSCDFT